MIPMWECAEYHPPLFLRQGHLNTLFAYLNCKVSAPPFEREAMETGDGDFVELDWIKQGSPNLTVLLHGLEGSSNSSYIRRMATLLYREDEDVCAMHHRSCGGKMNRLPTLYHSGFTRDLHELLLSLPRQYTNVRLVGYSLGGNVLLKYLGDGIFSIPTCVRSAVAVSTPVDLKGCALALSKRSNRIYEIGFLAGLKRKMRSKAKDYPSLIEEDKVRKIKRLIEFDNTLTAPLHGFKDAWEYYDRCSSRPFLRSIAVPTLLINALDDPMLSEASFPYEIAEQSKWFSLCTPRHGGHVGFAGVGESFYWIDRAILAFLKAHS